jgi:hypothetical protein
MMPVAEKFIDSERSRVDSLRQFVAELDEALKNDISRDKFTALFALAVTVLELDDEAAALRFKTSRPSISRWTNGQSAPHAVARPYVFRELRKVANERIRRLDSVLEYA